MEKYHEAAKADMIKTEQDAVALAGAKKSTSAAATASGVSKVPEK